MRKIFASRRSAGISERLPVMLTMRVQPGAKVQFERREVYHEKDTSRLCQI